MYVHPTGAKNIAYMKMVSRPSHRVSTPQSRIQQYSRIMQNLAVLSGGFIIYLFLHFCLFLLRGLDKHEQTYVQKRFLYFQIQERRWRLRAAVLRHYSDVFKGMLEIPTPAGSEEGWTYGSPILLHGVTSLEFSWLVYFLERIPCNQSMDYSFDGLVAVLRLSDMYDIAAGVQFAMHALEKRKEFNVVTRLKMSMAFDVPRSQLWFKTATKALILARKNPLEAQQALSLDARSLPTNSKVPVIDR
ncbi:hypothetical protein PHLGIDRAFT_123296 [Phlebiopsis gigantea 11061_1 CR5-6]|uniref:BTB domain-containing protein n=1 Tax=Phlebiopsis gigantea (strain 11061_1 CR5-6) TaxID=745531 RepID=A0A0C3RYX0_PHLG1|nr:hypothetical protein PHLGIDRAFT_123296 [Phlebiopsis gigantea 11061_1 CR5-6]